MFQESQGKLRYTFPRLNLQLYLTDAELRMLHINFLTFVYDTLTLLCYVDMTITLLCDIDMTVNPQVADNNFGVNHVNVWKQLLVLPLCYMIT